MLLLRALARPLPIVEEVEEAAGAALLPERGRGRRDALLAEAALLESSLVAKVQLGGKHRRVVVPNVDEADDGHAPAYLGIRRDVHWSVAVT